MTAMYTAAARGHVAVADALHAAGAAHSLHDVCLAGDVDRVKALLDKGADVNAKDKDGYTAAVWARNAEHAEVADTLDRHIFTV